MESLKGSSGQKNQADNRRKILDASLQLFAEHGYGGTPTSQIAQQAGISEGTIFRYFPGKKDILAELVTAGWVTILTDLLNELSMMADYTDVESVLRSRMRSLENNTNLMKVCFYEAQHFPELREQVYSDVIVRVLSVAEAFFQTAIDRGVYRKMNPKTVAKIFLGMFMVAGFEPQTMGGAAEGPQALDEDEMVRGISDIFLNGVLAAT